MVKIVNRLQTLISQLCPNGVEYKSLGELATDIYRGSGIKRDEVTEIGTPCVRYGEIYTTYGIWFEECVSHTIEVNIVNRKYFEHGDILFAITGESVEEIAKSCAYIGNERCLAGGDIVVLKHNQDAKYLSYALSTAEAQMQKSRGKVKSKVVHSSVPAIKEIVVPIPPLEVQREIVRILDNFTVLIANLIAELTVRKTQYEFYRRRFYSGFQNCDIEWMKTRDLKDDSFWLMPATPNYIDAGVPYITSKNIRNGCIDFSDIKYISEEDFLKISGNRSIQKNDLLITMIGTIGEAAFVDEFTYFYGQNMYLVRLNEQKILRKYYYYYLTSEKVKSGLMSKKNASSQGYIKAGSIEEMEIPVPTLEMQRKIVYVLEHFDNLCNDLVNGLPAEIEARQKQYEYYRDKLLTFKELSE